jgi:hypothetical protein
MLLATGSTGANGRIRIVSGGFHILPRRRSQAILRIGRGEPFLVWPMEGAMAKLATPEHEHVKRLNADGVYAVLVVLWIVAVWVVALYVAADAANDMSAGVGGNSFLFGCSLATAGVVTAFSLREFWTAHRRWRDARVDH